MRNTVKLYFTT